MTKKYNSPMLQVVSIKNNDIITDSVVPLSTSSVLQSGEILAPGQRNVFDEWYEGY